MDSQDDPIRHFARMVDFANALKPLPAQVLGHGYFVGVLWIAVDNRSLSRGIASHRL